MNWKRQALWMILEIVFTGVVCAGVLIVFGFVTCSCS